MNEVVLISYSTGTCNQGGVWNVPRDTVQRITVSPKKTLLLAQLDVNLSEYEAIPDKQHPDIIYYNNATEGVHIQSYLNKVTSIDYLPAASDNHLRCRTSIVGPPVTKSGKMIESHSLFDSYGAIPFNLEKQHLDFLGRKLRDLPSARAYIVAYGGRRISARQAMARAIRAKRYLHNNYNLPDNSIEIVKGGSLGEFKIQLYLVQ
jgi:hypothetical protein